MDVDHERPSKGSRQGGDNSSGSVEDLLVRTDGEVQVEALGHFHFGTPPGAPTRGIMLTTPFEGTQGAETFYLPLLSGKRSKTVVRKGATIKGKKSTQLGGKRWAQTTLLTGPMGNHGRRNLESPRPKRKDFSDLAYVRAGGEHERVRGRLKGKETAS